MTDYTTLLKEKNLTVTPQRVFIVELLYKKGHINIESLYTNLQKSFSNISLATVYKNLHKMIDVGFVSEVKINSEKNVYELTKEKHNHLVCNKCNMISDIHLENIDLQNTNISDFSVESYDLTLYGICKNCKEKH